jgi:hypothetical protein
MIEPYTPPPSTGRLLEIEGIVTQNMALMYEQLSKTVNGDGERFPSLTCHSLSYIDRGAGGIHLIPKFLGLDTSNKNRDPAFELLVRGLLYIEACQSEISRTLMNGDDVLAVLSMEAIFSHFGNLPYEKMRIEDFRILQLELKRALKKYFRKCGPIFSPHRVFYIQRSPEQVIKDLTHMYERKLSSACEEDIIHAVRKLDASASENPTKWITFDGTLPFGELAELVGAEIEKILKVPYHSHFHQV